MIDIMSYYYIKRDDYDGEFLEHSTGPWEEHSYTLRTGSKNNYSYTYPKAIIQRYNENRKRADAAKAASKSAKRSRRKSAKTTTTSKNTSKKTSAPREKFFRYMGGNFNKYFQQNYQQSKDKKQQSLYSSAGQADALMKQINEGRSKNVEADLIAVRHHLDEINKSGSKRDREGAARMASEFMHDLQEGDPDNAKKYGKILGTGTYDLNADKKSAREEAKKKKEAERAAKKAAQKKKEAARAAEKAAAKTRNSKTAIIYSDFEDDHRYRLKKNPHYF